MYDAYIKSYNRQLIYNSHLGKTYTFLGEEKNIVIYFYFLKIRQILSEHNCEDKYQRSYLFVYIYIYIICAYDRANMLAVSSVLSRINCCTIVLGFAAAVVVESNDSV